MEIFFQEKKLEPIHRRIIIVGYQFSWDKAWKEQLPFNEWMDEIGKAAPTLGFKVLGYPIYDIRIADKYFCFQPNHPQKDTAYAMCDLIPDQYIQINEFHEYFQRMKNSAFIQLCASLGAKEIYLESGKINKKEFSLKADTGIPTELGNIGIGFSTNTKCSKNYMGKLVFTFSEKNRGLKIFDSPWINTEPTWQAMINMRKNNYVETFNAEYNYIDNFGIDSKISTKIRNVGVNTGGVFTEFNKIELKYSVVFW
jgi:hypothetical protein